MEPQTSVQPDPATQPASDAQNEPKGKIPVLYRIYGLYCFVSAAIVLGLIITITVLSTAKVIDLTAGSNNASLTFILTVIQFVLMGIEAVAMIGFGISLLRNRRRHAAQKRPGPVQPHRHPYASPQQRFLIGIDPFLRREHRHAPAHRTDLSPQVGMFGQESLESRKLVRRQVSLDVIESPRFVILYADSHYSMLFISPMILLSAVRALNMYTFT